MASSPPSAPPNAQAILSDTASRVFEIFGARPATGRVWAALYLSDGALDATQLSSALGHSSGAVSMALSDLVRFGFVYRQVAPGSRRQIYLAEPDLWVVLRQLLTGEGLEQLRGVVASVQAAQLAQKEALATAAQDAKPAASVRLERLHHLTNVVEFVLGTLLAAADRTRMELKAASKILSVTGFIGGEPLHRLREKINARHLARTRAKGSSSS